MGERKGVNKYYPPDYDPEKGGLNKFLGTHALRERARKLHLGILIIRFELPYNIWCDGCENHIGTGVRYNAEKKKVGMYYSTPIYQFRMKCHLCDNHFEIKTDPANLDYVIVSGARRQERRWDPEENEQIAPEDKEVTRKLAKDAMFRLEHGVEDKDKSKEAQSSLTNLEEFQKSRWEDDFAANQVLREKMRVKRVEHQVQKKKDERLNLSIALLPDSDEDTRVARLLRASQTETSEEKQERKRSQIDSESVFGSNSKEIFPKDKKGFARQSLKNIVTAKQQNFSSFSNSYINSDLGIRKKNSLNKGAELPSKTEKKSLGIVSYDYSSSNESE